MPLELITGPPNAAKARLVLDGYRAALADEPILVLPTVADAEHYRRELARAGAVLGTRVERFSGLIAEVARRAGVAEQPLGTAARRRVLASVTERARLRSLQASAGTPGFVSALEGLVSELGATRVKLSRLSAALTSWADGDAERLAYGQDVVALLRAHHSILDRLGRLDPETHAARALDVLRLQPSAWGGTPVFFYGFDDLTAIELDAVETLARVVDAPVVFALSHERSRIAFAARTAVHERLDALATTRRELPASADYYAPGSRPVLHHLERNLFEGSGGRVDAGDAVRLLEGGGERAELELVATEVRALIDGGTLPEEIAIVIRSTDPARALAGPVLDAFEVPHDAETESSFARTALGRGLLALIRASGPDGRAGDLVAWLRTPGLLEQPVLADRLEAEILVRGLSGAGEARALWEGRHFPLDALKRLGEARERGGERLLAAVRAELCALFAAGRRRAAEVLSRIESADGEALSVACRALDELIWLVSRERAAAPDAQALHDLLAELELRPPAASGPEGVVAVLDPLALRARRVRALFVCGCVDGLYPARGTDEPFFGDADRGEIAAASGLALQRAGDTLARERQLFHALVSRPEELLVLSWRSSDDDGNACVRSLFVDDVADLLDEGWAQRRRVRLLGEVGWPAAAALPASERQRTLALAGPRLREAPIAPLSDPSTLEALASRPAWSASSLELWAGCPVRWFVERFLGAGPLEPESEHLVRGTVTHAVLETALRGLADRTGDARLTEDRLALARELVADELARQVRDRPLSTVPERRAAALRRLESDLDRFLVHASSCETALTPAHLELSFGDLLEVPDPIEDPGRDDRGEAAASARPPFVLASGGRSVPLRGRIDRVDVDAEGRAVVIDYKGATTHSASKWLAERNYQVAIYMLAVRELLDLEPVGGLYQPLAGRDLRARGVMLEGVHEHVACRATDRASAERMRELVDAAIERVLDAADEARAGRLESRAPTCAFGGGGCAYPSICRLEA